jgi:hypothetical protein
MRYFNDEDEYWGGSAEKIIDQGRLTARSIKMFADGEHTRIYVFALADETVVKGALRSGYAAVSRLWPSCPHFV